MLKRTTIAAALTLAACGQPSGTTTIATNSQTRSVTTATTGTAPSAAALGIQPGKWETVTTVLSATATGLPAGAPRPPIPGPTTITACITPEQAAKNPGELLRNAKLDCTITNSLFGGGRVTSDASCKIANGRMTMRTSGRYTPTEVTYDSDQTLTMGPIVATQKARTVSRRVGDCG